MRKVSVFISSELNEKLALIAQKSGRSIEDCAEIALRDYIENSEDTYKTDLCAVNSCERGFFLSLGE